MIIDRAMAGRGGRRETQGDEGSEPKVGWILGPPQEKFLQLHPSDSLKMLSRILEPINIMFSFPFFGMTNVGYSDYST